MIENTIPSSFSSNVPSRVLARDEPCLTPENCDIHGSATNAELELATHPVDHNCDSCRILRIERDIAQIKDMVAKVVADVKPTLDELMNSSLIKMLGVKKK